MSKKTTKTLVLFLFMRVFGPTRLHLQKQLHKLDLFDKNFSCFCRPAKTLSAQVLYDIIRYRSTPETCVSPYLVATCTAPTCLLQQSEVLETHCKRISLLFTGNNYYCNIQISVKRQIHLNFGEAPNGISDVRTKRNRFMYQQL